jgi:putative aminopeptidase FrvX
MNSAEHAHVALLRELSEANAVSGFEDEVQRLVASRLPDGCAIDRDRLGNLFARIDGDPDGPEVLLVAHVDEIGFIVTSVTEGGFLRFREIGSWSPGSLPGQRVVVMGRRGAVDGVIGSTPSPLAPGEARDETPVSEMFIDVGARDSDEVRAIGVRLGAAIVPRTTFTVTADGSSVIGKALDDRVGVALLIAALTDYAGGARRPNSLTGVCSVQEELGSRGAKAIGGRVRPDIAFVFEGILARDVPRADTHVLGSVLGGGPNLVFHDDSMVAHPKLLEWCIDVAEEAGIAVQLTPAFGSNDAGAIHVMNGGTPTLVVGVPCRYIHSHNGLLRLEDFDAAVRFVNEVLARLDRAALDLIVSV